MSSIITLLKGLFSFFNGLFGNFWGGVVLVLTSLATMLLGLPAWLFELFIAINVKMYNLSVVELMKLINNTDLGTHIMEYPLLSSSIDFLVYANYFVPIWELSKYAVFLFEFGMIFAFVVFCIKAIFQLAPTGG